MKELNQLVELDTYFKYYDIFNKYLKTVKKQYESLKQIKNKINEMKVPISEEDKSLAGSFEHVVNKIEEESIERSDKFNKYDFSQDTVKENYNDYRILCYKFAKENTKRYLDKHIESEGKFDSEEELIYYLDRLEMMLWEFFSRNFNYTDEILSIFDSAKKDILNEKISEYIS